MRFLYLILLLVFFSCQKKKIAKASTPFESSTSVEELDVSLILLGTLQDKTIALYFDFISLIPL